MRGLLLLFLVALSGVAWGSVPKAAQDRVSCHVRTLFAADRPGGRCLWYDEVMVGVSKLDPLTIRCARLVVDCSRRGKAVSVEFVPTELSAHP